MSDQIWCSDLRNNLLTKWFRQQFILTADGWRMYPFHLPLSAPACCWVMGTLSIRAVESKSEGFWTWGVGVAENFNDSDSGLTFCSPIVTVCATNVRKRHTWQFKQLNVSTKDDHGYSESLQHTNLHAHTQGRFQVSSDTRAHHATFAEWVQPFEVCVTEISICFHSGWHYRWSVTLVTQQWTSKKFSWELHCYVRTSQSNDKAS